MKSSNSIDEAVAQGLAHGTPGYHACYRGKMIVVDTLWPGNHVYAIGDTVEDALVDQREQGQSASVELAIRAACAAIDTEAARG